ncbi:MAG: RES family NAD+ phosphorylase [Planctomycetota bacterium]
MAFIPHPRFNTLKSTLNKLCNERRLSRWHGVLYRFSSPDWASPKDLINGGGGYKYASRWLLPYVANAVFASTEASTALEESLAGTRRLGFPDWKAMPKLVVAIRVKLTSVLDLTQGRIRQRLRLSEGTIQDTDWDGISKHGGEAITQALGRAAFECGLEGILTPSAAWPGGVNLVVFPDNLETKSYLAPLR